MALLHPASAGHGIDGLQKHFSTVAWFCLPDSFEMYDQCNKRIVRSGQAETVSIYRIIAENGIADERIVRRLAEKEAEQEIFYQHLEGKL
jgi:SNF2 family DNA or RNA helicase